jgi:integrase
VIDEHAVAAELDLSRMPVHEAVGRLAADRFVTVLPRRGSVVTTFGVDEVLDLFEAREAVECGLAYIAARRANAEDLAELRRLVLAAEQAREGSDHMAFLRDDHEIHSLLVHMVPNPLLQDDGQPWHPDHVSKRFKKLAALAGVPVVTLHEGGRHTGNSLMQDAGVDQELRMREVGHADRSVNDRYTHPLEQAHLAASEQTAALVRKAGKAS